MARIFPNGITISGQGGSGIYATAPDTSTTRLIVPMQSGQSNIAGARVIGFQQIDGKPWIVRCNPDGTELTPLKQIAVNVIVGGQTAYAWSVMGNTYTETSWGLRITGALALWMTADGSLIVLSNYQTGRGVVCYRNGNTNPAAPDWSVPSATTLIRYPYPQLYALDATRVVWCDVAGNLGTYGLPQPAPWLDTTVSPFIVTDPDGNLWLGGTGSKDRVMVRPWDDASRGYILGSGYGASGAGSYACWAANTGENPATSHEIDWTAPLVALPTPDADPEPPSPPTPPVPPSPPEPPMTTPNHFDTVQAVFAEGGFDLTTEAGCGLFKEACVRALHARDERWGELIKHSGQRQFRGHAVDAALYRHDGDGRSVAVDLISNSKTPALAAPSWSEDIPRYSPSDWEAPEPCPVSRNVRPSMPFLVVATCFDLGVSRDFALVDELKAAGIDTLRIVVASRHRTDRTLEQGRLQLRSLLPKLIERGMKASVVVNCDTKLYGMTAQDMRDHTAFVNAILRDYPAAVALVELFNENSHGVEVAELATDPYFLRELDALIDAQFPVAWGANHGGEAITDRLAGGSVICYHSDRSLSPEENAGIMSRAKDRFIKPVVNMEPKGMDEVARGDARTDDPAFIERQAKADKDHMLGGSCYHFEAGLTARIAVPPYGPKQMQALSLFGAVFATTPPPQPPVPLPPTPPPAGDTVLDASLTPAYPVGYQFFVDNYRRIEDEAQAWYYRAFKRHPADSDIAHGVYRAIKEGDRWETLRNAFEDAWPGGGR